MVQIIVCSDLVLDHSARESYDRVFDLLEEHHRWFRESLPLIASENVSSPAVREAVASDLGHRYAEGWVGERVYAGNVYVDQIEQLCLDLMKSLFDAEFVDVRPISGVTANLAVYTAFSDPGDTLMCLSIPTGGHISMAKKRLGGTAGAVHGLKVEYFPFDEEEMNIDVDEAKKKISQLSKDGKAPKIGMFGASVFLRPHPVKELAETIKSVGGTVVYDAAHVAGLIAGGVFGDPLREGADAVTLSTHKTLFGPQRGAILSWEKHAEQIKRGVFPGVTSNHHLHTLAGLAVAATEMLAFGEQYTVQVVRNAKALASGLHDEGVDVLGEAFGFTESHTVIADVTKYGLGGDLEKKLEQANIILNRNLLPYDLRHDRHFTNPGGIRLGSLEVTRLGMKEDDMKEIARLIGRVIVKGEAPTKVRDDVKEFRSDFQKIHYCFDTAKLAHEFLRFE